MAESKAQLDAADEALSAVVMDVREVAMAPSQGPGPEVMRAGLCTGMAVGAAVGRLFGGSERAVYAGALFGTVLGGLLAIEVEKERTEAMRDALSGRLVGGGREAMDVRQGRRPKR